MGDLGSKLCLSTIGPKTLNMCDRNEKIFNFSTVVVPLRTFRIQVLFCSSPHPKNLILFIKGAALLLEYVTRNTLLCQHWVRMSAGTDRA